MTPEEENYTTLEKMTSLMAGHMKTIAEAADKAKANGVVTREEAEKDKKQINFATYAAAVGTVFGAALVVATGVWFIINFMVAPIKAEQDRVGLAVMEIQKDIRELYRVTPTEKSERLERPVPVVPTKE